MLEGREAWEERNDMERNILRSHQGGGGEGGGGGGRRIPRKVRSGGILGKENGNDEWRKGGRRIEIEKDRKKEIIG